MERLADLLAISGDLGLVLFLLAFIESSAIEPCATIGPVAFDCKRDLSPHLHAVAQTRSTGPEVDLLVLPRPAESSNINGADEGPV